MNKDYLQGIIDATIETNKKLAFIESKTIEISIGGAAQNKILVGWESDVKITSPQTYDQPQETEIIYGYNQMIFSKETPVIDIVEFITDCTI